MMLIQILKQIHLTLFSLISNGLKIPRARDIEIRSHYTLLICIIKL